MSEECDHETLRTGDAKELKEALRRHGRESGSTDEATRAWRSHGSIRNGERGYVPRHSLDEEDE